MIGQVWESSTFYRRFETIKQITPKWITFSRGGKFISPPAMDTRSFLAGVEAGTIKKVWSPKIIHYFQHGRLHIQVVGDHGFVIGEIKQ